MDKKEFLNKIALIMKLCNLQLVDISFLTGINSSNISSSINGVSGVSDEVMLRYIEGLHIKTSWLEEELREDVSLEDIFEEGYVIRHEEEDVRRRIREVMDIKGVSELAGLDEDTIPTISTAKKLSMASGVSAEYLLYGIEKKKYYPLDDIVIRYLENNPEEMKRLWEKSREITDGGSFASRLWAVISHWGSNLTVVSRNMWTNVLQLHKYFKGEEKPDEAWLQAFGSFYGVDAEWLEQGGEVEIKKATLTPLYTKTEAREELRKLRKKLGLKQVDMAKNLSLSNTSYSRIETGDYGMPIEFVEKVREVYDEEFLRP